MICPKYIITQGGPNEFPYAIPLRLSRSLVQTSVFIFQKRETDMFTHSDTKLMMMMMMKWGHLSFLLV